MNSGQSITILMPTVNCRFARDALACLEAQTYRNLEIIISDNTSNGEIYNTLKVNSAEQDIPKIKLIHSFHETKGDIATHHRLLINKVQSTYFKFLFDDDLLSPLAVQYVHEIAEEGNFPAVFHNRYNFTNGKINLTIPQALQFQESIVKKMSFEEVAGALFTYCINIFSEPSFSLYRKDTISLMSSGVHIEGLQLRYLGDVAIPLLVAEKFGDIAISSARLGYFRRHSTQDSSPQSPARLSGLVEWELISRYLNQRIKFSADLLTKNKLRLKSIYQKGERQFPFLMERYERVIQNDKRYIFDQEFKDFFKKCEEFQQKGLRTV